MNTTLPIRAITDTVSVAPQLSADAMAEVAMASAVSCGATQTVSVMARMGRVVFMVLKLTLTSRP